MLPRRKVRVFALSRKGIGNHIFRPPLTLSRRSYEKLPFRIQRGAYRHGNDSIVSWWNIVAQS
jgi:hypothetical protein